MSERTELRPEVGQYLERLLSVRREDIIDRGTDWIIGTATDLKGRRPRAETRVLVAMEFDAYRDELLLRDSRKRDAFIEHVTTLRATSEFRISTLLRGFLGFKRGIEEVLPSENIDLSLMIEIRAVLDELYCDTAFLMADVYASKLLAVLRTTQQELMHREKMAALGGLVAGVAHEINTPMGIAVTAGSLLHDRVRDVEQSFAKGELKRSTLMGFLSDASQAAQLLLTNLHRAADLVQSFKQVAVDQSHDVRRRVRLGQYLGEVLTSLGPLYKRTPHVVRLVVVDEMEEQVHAGAIAQIVGNLVQNAMQHAFVGERPGCLDITLRRRKNGDAEILFADNGRGMGEEERARIFEPFFTTRRGQGGSGLGMHIVHNLTTELLRGSISVQSTPGEGTQITLSFPIGKDSALLGNAI
jgi:signal transduction histidine kinase